MFRRDAICCNTDFDAYPRAVAEAVRINNPKAVEARVPIQFEEAIPEDTGTCSYIAAKFLLRDANGKPSAVCAIATDITALERAEELKAKLAYEREMFAQQHAAELSKANEALRGCLDALATVPKLDEFLGRVMASITCQLGAASSTLRLCNFEDNALNLEFVFQDGRVVSPEEVSYPEPWRSIPLEEERFASLGDRITVRRVADPREPIPDSHRRYLLELGIKTVLVVPLVSLNQAVGRLTFRFTDDRSFRPAELEIARALASQASLAVQLTRLAEAARESAVLEERRLLAGEIHDSLAQSFATVSMQLSAAEDAISTGRSDGLSYVKRANELARFGLAEARRSALSLQAATIEECSLIEALELLVERSNVSGRVSCTFVSHGICDENLPLSAQQHLLRIAQEAISNALRHAKPTAINVSLRLLGSNLVLEVTDNGSGIRRVKLEPETGFGFVNMRRRVEKLSGLLELRTAPGHGTSIVVTLPIN